MTKSQIEKILAEPKIDIPNVEVAFLVMDLAFTSYASYSYKVTSVKPNYIASYVEPHCRPNFHQIIPQKCLEQIGERIYANYLKNPSSLDLKIRGHKEAIEKVRRSWLEYNSGKNKKSDGKKLFRNLNLWWSYAIVGEDRGRVIETKIIPAFAKRHRMDANQAREIVSVMSHPGGRSVLNIERVDFLNLCLVLTSNRECYRLLKQKKYLELSKKREVRGKITTYLKNNFWFKTGFNDILEIEPQSLLVDAHKLIKEKGEPAVKKELISIGDNLKKIHKEQREIIKRIKISTADRRDFNYARKIVQWIDWRKSWMMQSCYYTFLIARDIAKLSGVPYEDALFYHEQELIDLLVKGKRLNSKNLNLRKNNKTFSFYTIREKTKIFSDKEADDLFAIASREDRTEVCGVVASVGKKMSYQGKARIVLDPVKDEFNDGEILVTSMTRVEFVPLMRRALAIITNEGGLGCHAAIVSRELNLPCIIGTKNATKLLKNGDRIEMDMKSGKVKILK